MSSRRTVLTGIGLLSPLGLSAAATWEGICAGKSGVQRIQSFDASGLPVQIGGEILGFEPKVFIPKEGRKQVKVMARGIQLAVAAAQMALDDSGIDKTAIDPTRLGICFGSGILASDLKDLAEAARLCAAPPDYQVDMEKWGAEGLGLIEPLWLLKYLPNFLASHIAILQNAQGPNNSITESDASSLLAMGEAFRTIARNHADVLIVGGAESRVHPLTLSRLALFTRLTRRKDPPEKACRPFDRNRDGWVVAEGAGVLIAEELEHARRRGARIYAEVLGFASAFETRRDGSTLAHAIETALARAGVGAHDIDHVNAHGIGDRETDAWEAQGIARAFAGTAVPVFSAKGHLGNVGAAGGTLELALSLLGYQHGQLPATLNHEQADPACPVSVVVQPRTALRPCFMKISLNDMGQCAVVVCRRWEA
jgi:3-oxoacyl-[acyl-carrier-protein] synthase II